MKIVHLITRLILGGAQENTLITCDGLAERGHDVTLITGPAVGPEGTLFGQTENADYETIIINQLGRQINPLKDIPAYRHIKRHLEKISPDIVHTHSAKAGILGRFAACNLKVQEFVTTANAHNIQTTQKLASRTVTLKSRPAIVHTVHGLAFHRYQSQLLNRFYITVEKIVARRTDAFICVADEMTKKSLTAGIGKPSQYTTAYSAIDVDAFTTPLNDEQIKIFRKKYDIAQDATVLVTIARLFNLKGHKYIIESAKTLTRKYPQTIWLFVGDGILKQELKDQIASAGLENNFRFTGLLPVSDMPLVLQSSDILVHCSLREGLARVLPQALAAGKPAVSFDIDGAKEVINNNTGRLVQPKNIDMLIAACAELIENNDLRTQLGQTGRAFVKKRFVPGKMIDIIENVYERLL